MSARDTDAVETGRGKERRDAAGHRVHFEALVAVGGTEGGFEAESVDVSAQGMRLRTAYLPSVGDRLVCRFDGLSGELVVEGEVLWASEKSRGGEFAVRFVDIDDETREALKQLCVLEDADEAVRMPEERPTGARVRLHIEGLGSPMKARVKGGDRHEVSVGSNLEFLKLGRHVEMEDVDRGGKRDGFVDAVKVEVDPETSVPQLIVSLRFEGAQASAQPVAAAAAPAAAPASRKAPASAKVEASGDDETSAKPTGDEEIDGFVENRFRTASARAAKATGEAAMKIGPMLSGLGSGATRVWGRALEMVKQRREARSVAKANDRPKRVTAPPPSGALKMDGRKLVRESDQDEAPPSLPTNNNRRKVLMAGSIVAALVVGGVVWSKSGDKAGGEPTRPVITAQDVQKNERKAELPPIPNAAATGDVPFFGATPMSTTEQVPMPAPVASGAPSAAPGEAEEAAEEKPTIAKEFGEGEVPNAKAIKIKMDGPVAGITGEETEDGFVITVPERQSTMSATSLERKDKRFAQLQVTNKEGVVEIRARFKGTPPAYKVRAKNDRVEILLAGEAKQTASKNKKKPGAKKPH